MFHWQSEHTEFLLTGGSDAADAYPHKDGSLDNDPSLHWKSKHANNVIKSICSVTDITINLTAIKVTTED